MPGFEPTKEEIALDRWMHAPDWRLVRACRSARRWLGLGCRAIPWKNALPSFTCARSRKHSGQHVAKTLNGPIAWDAQWYMPPHEGLVREPSETRMRLVIDSRLSLDSMVFTHHLGVHTEEEHSEHLDFAVELDCVFIGSGLYATRTVFLSDETADALAGKRKPRGGRSA